MRILDQAGIEINNPDLDRGYLTEETLLVAKHPATSEVPEITERVVISEDPNNPNNRLYKTVVIQPYEPAHDAWDETETIQRYIPYTAAEMAERERQKAEIEKATAEAVAKRERMNALPGEVDDLYEAVAEVGVIADNTNLTLEDALEAIAELGVLIAGEE